MARALTAPQSIYSNFNDVDPITLEPIKTLQVYFNVLCPTTKNIYAYDAVAWLHYIAHSNGKWPTHPCTRLPLSPSDVWDCYATATAHLGEHHPNVKKLRTPGIRVISDLSGVRLQAVSPLFLINIVRTQRQTRRGTNTTDVEVTYNMSSSANPSRVLTPDSTLQLVVPSHFTIGVHF